MAVELRWPESHSDNSVTIEAIVDSVSTRADLYSAIVANIPLDFEGLIFNKIEQADRIDGKTDVWKARIRYAAFREKQQLKSGESEFQFSSANRSITRTFSISSRVFDSDGLIDPAPSDARVIGFNRNENTASGTQVTEYINAFSWRVAVPFSTATETWRRSAGNLKGSVCSSTFFGYPTGEVLFKDLSGSVKGDGLYIFTLDFLQGQNPGNITIGGIDVDDLEFWEHLDIDDQDLDERDGKIVPLVSEVKVHQLHRKASWSLLTSLLGMV